MRPSAVVKRRTIGHDKSYRDEMTVFGRSPEASCQAALAVEIRQDIDDDPPSGAPFVPQPGSGSHSKIAQPCHAEMPDGPPDLEPFAKDRAPPYTVTCVPISTTRPVGMWKYSVASVALRARAMNNRSAQNGMPPFADGFSERRDRKNEVDMMSNFQPSLRASDSAFGMFGVST